MDKRNLLLISNDQALIEIFQQLEGFELTISPHTWYVEPSQKQFDVTIIDADFVRMTENINLAIAKATVAFAIVSPSNLIEFLGEHRRKFYDFWVHPLYSVLLLERILKALEHEALYKPFSRAIAFIWQEKVTNPLHSVKGYVDVLLAGITGQLTEQQIRFLEIIKSTINQIRSNLTSYSQEVEMSVRFVPWASPVNVKETLLEMEKFLIEVTLELNLPDQIPVVLSDKAIFYHLARCLNLIIQRCTSQNRIITISVSVLSPHDVTFTIALPCFDYLSPIVRQKVSDFLPHLRRQIPLESELGSILGGIMSIHHYIYQVGSEVFFESEIGKGTTFYFTLPIAKDQASK